MYHCTIRRQPKVFQSHPCVSFSTTIKPLILNKLEWVWTDNILMLWRTSHRKARFEPTFEVALKKEYFSFLLQYTCEWLKAYRLLPQLCRIALVKETSFFHMWQQPYCLRREKLWCYIKLQAKPIRWVIGSTTFPTRVLYWFLPSFLSSCSFHRSHGSLFWTLSNIVQATKHSSDFH